MLSEGERRCRAYGIVNPVMHISHRDMLDKLQRRAEESGLLRCYICGWPITDGSWHLDHVRPLVAGGNHELSNVEPAHARCNLVKSDMDLYSPPLDDFVPLLDRLKAMPIEDLFNLDPELASWVLASQGEPYRSMAFTEIRDRGKDLGIKLSTGELADNHWRKLMGLGKFNSNDPAMRRHNHKRTAPSQIVAPVRVRDKPGEWGVAGFRLRFSVQVVFDGKVERTNQLTPRFG